MFSYIDGGKYGETEENHLDLVGNAMFVFSLVFGGVQVVCSGTGQSMDG
jgi:hypothetical protein